MIRRIRNILFLFILISWVLVPMLGAADTVVAAPKINNAFCSKCHTKEVKDIETEGMAHKTEISCTDCHVGHKPKSFENIPSCSLCHSGAPHYDQLQCLNCHRNPHRPLEIKLPKKAHAECLTCHDSQGEELQQFPSYHSTLVCTDCHYEHAFLPECMSCHKSHGDSMAEEICQTCHAPHKPLDIAYGDDVPSRLCSPCHTEAATLMGKTQSKHGQLNCSECHRSQHGIIPECQDCHEKPHADALHTKFSKCGECHVTAHNLD